MKRETINLPAGPPNAFLAEIMLTHFLEQAYDGAVASREEYRTMLSAWLPTEWLDDFVDALLPVVEGLAAGRRLGPGGNMVIVDG